MMTRADAEKVEEKRAREKALVDASRRIRRAKEGCYKICPNGCNIQMYKKQVRCLECGADLVWSDGES